MNSFILVTEAETGAFMVVATKDIAVVTQTSQGSNISFSGMHHDIDIRDGVGEVWNKIHRKETLTHG